MSLFSGKGCACVRKEGGGEFDSVMVVPESLGTGFLELLLRLL